MQSFFSTVLLFSVLVAPAQAHAQSVPLVQRDLYKGGLRQSDSTIKFCVWPESALYEFDLQIAQAVADTLLLDAKFHDVPGGPNMVQSFESELFIKLMDECDLAMGANFSWAPLPEWLTISRPYYDAPYVAVSQNPAYGSLNDIPKGKLVGSRAFTSADMTIAEHLTHLGAARTWSRVPHRTSAELYSGLVAEKLDAAIFWAPELLEIVGKDEINAFRILDTGALRLPPTKVGIAMLSKNRYMRTMVDESIDHLHSTGRISEIASASGMLEIE